MGQVGETMAGVGGCVAFRDAQRVAQQYGGNAADWVKKTSSSYQRVEFKTKFPGGD